MCDAFALKRAGAVWFAKNSDREPDEPQIVERHSAVVGDTSRTVRCTYIEIDQVPDRRAVAISRPEWMWGAEMGVNDAGVAIGNEAVFSRSILKKGEALLGMDLLRLALERAANAREALDVITSMLRRYGQGGPAGWRDRNFRYDNSFLIADPYSVYVLETAGRDYAAKRVDEGWSISNAYTLRDDADLASDATVCDFKKRHEAFLLPRLAMAADRRAATYSIAHGADDDISLSHLAAALRRHAAGDGFDGGSNRDVCMHASGPLRPHATTASMIAKLAPGAPPVVAFTGTPVPCVSLFKPAGVDAPLLDEFPADLFALGVATAQRAKADPLFRRGIRRSIEEIEPALLAALECGATDEARRRARAWTDERLNAC